jgi:hypothetical protein
MEQIKRIRSMERLFDFALKAIKELSMNNEHRQELEEAIEILSAYYSSNDWKQDYADDEAGRLPKDLKRGVLSEDGIWNLLSDWKALNSK